MSGAGETNRWNTPQTPGDDDLLEAISNSTRNHPSGEGPSVGKSSNEKNLSGNKKKTSVFASKGKPPKRAPSGGKKKASLIPSKPRKSRSGSRSPSQRSASAQSNRLPSLKGVGAASKNKAAPRKSSAGRRATGSVSTSSRRSLSASKRKSTLKSKGRSLSAGTRSSGKSSKKFGVKKPSLKKAVGGKKKNSISVGKRRSASSSRASIKSTSSKGKGKDKTPKKGAKKKSRASDIMSIPLPALLEKIDEAQSEQRQGIIAEEELQRESFHPLYHVFVLALAQSQSRRSYELETALQSTLSVMREVGIHCGDLADPTCIELNQLESLPQAIQAALKQHDSTLVEENKDVLERCRDEVISLRAIVNEKKDALQKCEQEYERIRDRLSRLSARYEVERGALQSEVHAVLHGIHVDVSQMKRELANRIDIATASLRTPKYDTALRSMQDLVEQVRNEIQTHHDTLTQLIVSIEAKDTFLKETESETMHTNFPPAYRTSLRKLEKDQLLNMLDVLSFQEGGGVVEAVGKALYVLNKCEYQTTVV